MEEKEEFEIEKIIPVNVIEDSKQMRVTIPAEIVEDFSIDTKRHQFAWIVQREVNSNRITISGKFILKENGKKEN
jgi:hypothetical protein